MFTVQEKWEEIIQKLKVEYFLSNISFDTWIRPLEVYDIVDNTKDKQVVVFVEINPQNLS